MTNPAAPALLPIMPCPFCGRNDSTHTDDCYFTISDNGGDVTAAWNRRAPEALLSRAATTQAGGWIEAASRIATEIIRLLPEDAIMDPDGQRATHLTYLAERLVLGNVGSETKTCRWLGYLQAGLVMKGLSTLSAEKDRNRRHSPKRMEGFDCAQCGQPPEAHWDSKGECPAQVDLGELRGILKGAEPARPLPSSEQELAKFVSDLVAAQKPFDADVAKIIRDNWNTLFDQEPSSEQPVMSKSMAKRIAAQQEQEPTAAEWRKAILDWADRDITACTKETFADWIENRARELAMERKA